jgi:hypothetical protein
VPTLNFNALPEATRRGLATCLRRQAAPEPVIADLVPFLSDFLRGIVLLVAGTAGITACWWAGFGKPESALSFQDWSWFGVWVLAASFGFYGLLTLVREALQNIGLAWPRGRFVLPHCFVDARSIEIRSFPLHDLVELRRGVRGRTGRSQRRTGGSVDLELVFTGGRVERFPMADLDAALRAERSVELAWNALYTPPTEGEVPIREAFAPLCRADLRAFQLEHERAIARRSHREEAVSPPTPSGPMARRVPFPFRHPLALTSIIVVPASYGLLQLRNQQSDDALVAELRVHPRRAAVEVYLRDHGPQEDLVRKEILPAALLARATGQDDGSGTVDAGLLRHLRRVYAGSPVGLAASEALARRYDTARGDLRQQLAPGDTALVQAFLEMLQVVEARDEPSLRVRIEVARNDRLTTKETVLRRRNALLKTVPMLAASPATSSRQVQPIAHAAMRALAGGFAVVVPESLLCFETNEDARAKNTPPLPDAGPPTLLMQLEFLPSSKVFDLEGQDRPYLGVILDYRLALYHPDQGERWRTQGSFEPSVLFGASQKAYHEPDELYAMLARFAIDGMTLDLRDRFFDRSSPAWAAVSVESNVGAPDSASPTPPQAVSELPTSLPAL